MKWFSGTGLAALLALGMTTGALGAEKQYGPGVSDTEIKIGNTMPYSGPASAYGTIGKTEAAYFTMINEQGGINGRKINFISRDDGYSPPKTVEQARQLVEQDQVLLLFSTLGTPTNTAIQELPERKQGAAIVRRQRRRPMERSQALSLDDGLVTQLPHRGAHLCALHSEEPAGRQNRGALSERRFRQGLS